MKSKIKEWSAGAGTGFILLAFGLSSALTFGWAGEITSFLEGLSTTTVVLGPFDLSQASVLSILLVIASGGINITSYGANSEDNHYATLGLIGLFLLMGLPSFQEWVASNQAISFIGLALSLAGYSVIGGLGISSEKDESIISNASSKLTGGYL